MFFLAKQNTAILGNALSFLQKQWLGKVNLDTHQRLVHFIFVAYMTLRYLIIKLHVMTWKQ